MTAQRPYNQQTLNIRAAEFYKSIRKEKSKWKSIIDLSPMLAEFNHYIAAGDYEKAFHVYDEIFGYLTNWSENLRLIEMGEKLLEKRLFGKSLPEHMIIRIMTYICWGCFYSGQIDKGEKAALEAKMIGEKLLEQESSDDFAHERIHEFMSIVDSVYWGLHVITGRYEHCKELLSEAEEQLKNVESTRYKARHYIWHGWALEEMGDERSFEKRFTADKLFDEVEEEKLSAFFLGDKARTKFSVSKEWAKKGQIEAGYEAYKESHRIHEKIHDDLYSMVVPNWGGHSVRHSYRFTEARKIANAGVSISEKAEMWYLYEKNIIYMGNSLRDEGLWNIYINKSESEEKKEHQKIAFSFFQSAIDTMQKAIEVANTLGIISDIAMLHGKIGNIYCHMGHGNADLFRLAEENLEKALDVCPTVHGKYHTNLDLGRLYVFWAGKLFKDGKNEAKEVENKVKEAEKRFSLVYKDTENKAYRAKAAFGLGVVAFETVLIEKLKGDDRKKKFDEAWDKFREACELFEKCESKVMEDKFLSGQEAEDFTNKYNEQPIDLRSRAEMQYGQAAALVGLSIYADEYTDEEDLKLARMWLTDKRDLIYDQAFKQVSKSVDFLRDAYRDLNMLRVSLDKEENEAQKVMDDSRKVVISTWLKENKGIEEKHDETAELKWGFPISKEAIE